MCMCLYVSVCVCVCVLGGESVYVCATMFVSVWT